jgi:cbb3-type cytochrome oxidase subunit 3
MEIRISGYARAWNASAQDSINDFIEYFICSLLLILFSWLLHFVIQFLLSQKNKQQQTRYQARQGNLIEESEANDTKRKDGNMNKQPWNQAD